MCCVNVVVEEETLDEMLKTQMRKCWLMSIILGTKNNMSKTGQLRNNSVTQSAVSLFIPSFYCDNYYNKVTPSKMLQQIFVENYVIWFSSLILRCKLWPHLSGVSSRCKKKLIARRSFTYILLHIWCTLLYLATHYLHDLFSSLKCVARINRFLQVVT